MLNAPQLRTLAGAKSSLYSEGDAFGVLILLSPITHALYDSAIGQLSLCAGRKACQERRGTYAQGRGDVAIAVAHNMSKVLFTLINRQEIWSYAICAIWSPSPRNPASRARPSGCTYRSPP